jgi:hypothetical protein
MSLMDKLKSMFSGGSADDHAGHDHDHDHAGHDHSHEPVAPPVPPADPALIPTSEDGENKVD